MQAFLSLEPVVSWSRGLETSGSGDENGMQVTHVPSMRNGNLGIRSVGSSCRPPNCKNKDALGGVYMTRGDFRPGARSLRFPLMALYLFT